MLRLYHNHLTIALAGEGRRAVSSDPEGIACGTVCALPDLVKGSVVTLTAVASPGPIFTGWSGDLVNVQNPITVTMDANKTITATFAQDEIPPPDFATYLPLIALTTASQTSKVFQTFEVFIFERRDGLTHSGKRGTIRLSCQITLQKSVRPWRHCRPIGRNQKLRH